MMFLFLNVLVSEDKTDKRIFRPFYITIFGGLRWAQSFCKLLRLIGICGKMSGQSDDHFQWKILWKMRQNK